MPPVRAFLRAVAAPWPLTSRVVKGGGWSIAELLVSLAVRLASNLAMAQLVAPEAFGLMAIVTSLLIAFELTSDLGIRRSVVQNPRGAEPFFLRVCWTVQALRGAALAGLTLMAAGLLWVFGSSIFAPASVYADARLPALVALSALSPLLSGLESPNKFVAERDMKFGRVAIVNLASQAFAVTLMIGFGLFRPTVWALMIGALGGAAFRMVLTHLAISGPRMTPSWDQAVAEELWQVGRWVIGSSALTFLSGYADRLLFATFLDTRTFGLYAIAVVWVQAAQSIPAKLTDPVGVVYFAEAWRRRPAEAGQAFLRFARVIDALSVSLFAVLLVVGAPLLSLIYPSEYAGTARLMPFLAVGVLAFRFNVLSVPMLGVGQNDSVFWNSVARALASCLAIPMGYLIGGMEGAMLSVALSPLAGVPVLLPRVRALLGLRLTGSVVWVAATLGAALLISATHSLAGV